MDIRHVRRAAGQQPQNPARLRESNPLARGLTFLKSVPGSAAPATVGACVATALLGTEPKANGQTTRFTGYGSGTVDTLPGIGQSPKGTVLVLHQSSLLPPNGPYPNPGYCHVLAATSSGSTTGFGWLLMLANGTGNLVFRAFGPDNGTPVASADGSTPLNDGRPHVTVATWDSAAGSVLSTYVDGIPHAASGALSADMTIAQPMRLGRSWETSGFWGALDGNMYLAATWNRILSADEIRAVSNDPWQLFAQKSLPVFAPARAIGDTTLTGAASAVASALSSLSSAVRLTGAAQVAAGAAGALSTSMSLAGAAVGQATAIGALSAPGTGLSGTARAEVSGAAMLSTAIRLTGTGAAQVGGAGALATSIALGGVAIAGASGAGALATRLALAGASAAVTAAVGTLVDANKPPTGVDISQISAAHIAVFDGSGSRIAVFGGTGARTVINGMTMKLPTLVNGKMTVDRDPDEISWYGADITQELIDRATTPQDQSKVVPVLTGVALLEGPFIQTATKDSVTRTYVVVRLGGVDGALPADWNWIARVPCTNGERFDKTTYFNRVDT